MEVTSTFDAAGQITSSSDGTSYTWDDNGQLTRIDRPGAADDTDLEYNAFGELVGQDHGTASTSYERDVATVSPAATFVADGDRRGDGALERSGDVALAGRVGLLGDGHLGGDRAVAYGDRAELAVDGAHDGAEAALLELDLVRAECVRGVSSSEESISAHSG